MRRNVLRESKRSGRGWRQDGPLTIGLRGGRRRGARTPKPGAAAGPRELLLRAATNRGGRFGSFQIIGVSKGLEQEGILGAERSIKILRERTAE